jgi:hypothetical protein
VKLCDLTVVVFFRSIIKYTGNTRYLLNYSLHYGK